MAENSGDFTRLELIRNLEDQARNGGAREAAVQMIEFTSWYKQYSQRGPRFSEFGWTDWASFIFVVIITISPIVYAAMGG